MVTCLTHGNDVVRGEGVELDLRRVGCGGVWGVEECGVGGAKYPGEQSEHVVFNLL